LQFINEAGKARVEDLHRELGITRAMVHRHLNSLLKTGEIIKAGKVPLVYYLPTKSKSRKQEPSLKEIKPHVKKFIDSNYLYISPLGEQLSGVEGFVRWTEETKQLNRLSELAREFVKVRKEANQHFNYMGVVDATQKIKDTFNECKLDKVYYGDFYSLPVFGKTILGQKVLYAKQSQVTQLMKDISFQVHPLVSRILKKHDIKAVGFLPPTIPRKVQFMKELEFNLKIIHPRINFAKAYPGPIPVAQKSLSKLEQRVVNARQTIFIKSNVLYSNVLLIDDAVGSGATLNETAKKLRKFHEVKHVYGFTIVGSYKGFEVISEL
jgi:phosphoribosylpyrophosphate synthetase